MSLQAINEYVIVELNDVSTKNSGSIILTKIEPPCIGTIQSIGLGKVLSNGEREEHSLSAGDVIIFGRSALNTPLEDDDKKYYVMKISDIFGKKNG